MDGVAGVSFSGRGPPLGVQIPIPAGTTYFSLGIPKFRFGHDVSTGRPREFIGSNLSTFIGRFTHEETSNSNFNHPCSVGSDPYSAANITNWSLNASNTVTKFAGGSRQGEDILLTNVHSFDVKIYDDLIGQFVDLGHLIPGGGYASGKSLNSLYGAGGPSGNHVYDTWYTTTAVNSNTNVPYFIDLNNDNNPDPPPYISPVDNGKDGAPGIKGFDDDNNGTIDDASEQGAAGSDDIHPLRIIQIKIRFLDVTSNQMREVTIRHSLLE